MVTGTLFVLVLVLTLIAFVGEAVRVASDPKKFSTYQQADCVGAS